MRPTEPSSNVNNATQHLLVPWLLGRQTMTATTLQQTDSRRFLGFDLETVRLVPGRRFDDRSALNVGISCASLALSETEVKVWEGRPALTVEQCQEMVYELEQLSFPNTPHRLVTWNGASFDFRVLAEESQLRQSCVRLMVDHIDLMFLLVAQKGWLVSFENALRAMGLTGKKKAVALNDGSILSGMNGRMAPELWERGEYSAVVEYNKEDSIQTLKLAQAAYARQGLVWSAKSSGKKQSLSTPLLSVKECVALPQPDLSWMQGGRVPPTRHQLLCWAQRQPVNGNFFIG